MPLHTLWVSAEERVSEGITWLDANYPEWFNRIDLKNLNLDSWINCILGQLYGDYARAPRSATDFGISFGFWPRTDPFDQGDLETIWRREIKQRRVKS